MATVAAQISDTGIQGPDYANILQQLKIVYWSIYGSDAILDDDSQDGEFLGVLAKAIFDCNQTAIDIYNAFSPANARGTQLSILVKLNGLRRAVATNSEVVLVITGEVGRQIENGIVGDNLNLGTRWLLPTLVVIPVSGEITVTATAETVGDISVPTNSLTQILTPTLGWQSVTNPAVPTPGQPVETDAQLRVRQQRSTALPSMTILEGIDASVAAVPGVSRLFVYENDDDVADADGIPPHSISVVVSGGDVEKVAQAIALKKAPGVGTYGTTVVTVSDQRGVPNTIKFFELAEARLKVRVNIHPLEGYVSTTGDLLRQAVADFINGLSIGEDSYTSRLYSPANLGGTGLGATFVVLTIQQARIADPLSTNDVVVLFNEGAIINLSDVVLVLA